MLPPPCRLPDPRHREHAVPFGLSSSVTKHRLLLYRWEDRRDDAALQSINRPRTQNITSPIVEPCNAIRSAEAVGTGAGGDVAVAELLVAALSPSVVVDGAASGVCLLAWCPLLSLVPQTELLKAGEKGGGGALVPSVSVAFPVTVASPVPVPSEVMASDDDEELK